MENVVIEADTAAPRILNALDWRYDHCHTSWYADADDWGLRRYVVSIDSAGQFGLDNSDKTLIPNGLRRGVRGRFDTLREAKAACEQFCELLRAAEKLADAMEEDGERWDGQS